MIGALNQLVEHVETHVSDSLDVPDLARRFGTTEYHLRRMFASLVGMSLTEYVRRRRMTLAAADLVDGQALLDTATKYGYGSSEAFGRAFHSVHGVTPGEVRRSGGPLSSQPKLRFRLTIEGKTSMDTRIVNQPAFSLAGHSARVPLMHSGENPHISAHIASLPTEEHQRLKALSNMEPAGLLQISNDVDPDYTEGTELTYMHGVAVTEATDVPADLEVIPEPAGTWAVFAASGPYPSVLQELWASTANDWFPSNPWRLRPGPSIVAVLDRAEDFSTASTELWLPVEKA